MTVTHAFPSVAEQERRRRLVAEALRANDLDALLLAGSQYTGFEGAVRYMSGFQIVHRYAYVLVERDGRTTLIQPSEARWIGDRAEVWADEHVVTEVPGKFVGDAAADAKWRRVGTYGRDYVMAVRDYIALSTTGLELIPFDREFDELRAVKSDEELEQVRDAMGILEEGFERLVSAYVPGRTEAEIMAPAVGHFFAAGAGSRMMNILLSGPHGEAAAAFKIPSTRKVEPTDLLLYSLEITGPGGYWVEFSRPLSAAPLSQRTEAMAAAYKEALDAAVPVLRDGETAGTVHGQLAETFSKHGFAMGHLSGHGLGTTMLEHPAIGHGSDVMLKRNMVITLHPQVIDQDGLICLYTQDTYVVGEDEPEHLSTIPWKTFGDAA